MFIFSDVINAFFRVCFYNKDVRIIYDNQIFHLQRYGGVSRYFIELASALSRIQNNVEIKITAPLHFNSYLNNSKSLRKGNIYIPKSSEMFKFNQFIRQTSTVIANNRIDKFFHR